MISHVTINTAKFSQTIDFYEWLLDLTISRKISTPTGEIVFLGTNETKLELIETSQAEKINTKNITIGFSVKDLDEKIKMLSSKGIPHSSVISVPGARFLFFTDLNGVNIQLFESLV